MTCAAAGPAAERGSAQDDREHAGRGAQALKRTRLPQYGNVYYGKSLLTFYLVPTAKKGPLQDPRIRQALFLATDRAGVARVVFNGGARASTTVVPHDAYADIKPTTSADTGGSAADLKEAERLVAQAGSPKQAIILAGTEGISDTLPQTLQALVQAGRQIGLNMQYKSVTLDQFYAFFAPGGWKATNVDGFGSQWNLPVADPLSQYTIWTDPSGYLNYGGFSDPATTKLISAAASDGDPSTRAAELAAVDQRLATELPWIPVVDVSNVLYLAKGLTGPPASQVNWYSPWAGTLGSG